MRIVGLASFGFVVVLAAAGGCATGVGATADDTSTDAGTKPDGTAPPKQDSGTPPKQDSGTPPKQDSGTPPQDSGNQQPCGGPCLGQDSTCCTNTCVDITSDPNNCGGCGTACGAQSCCAGNCIDTMGSDNSNCGGCGVTCSGTCTSGVCQTTTTCTEDLGSCSHSVCVSGSALPEDCDLSENDTTFCVCELLDDSCCTTSWTASCVLDAQACSESCTDPGCQ